MPSTTKRPKKWPTHWGLTDGPYTTSRSPTEGSDMRPRCLQGADLDGVTWRVATYWAEQAGRIEPIEVRVQSFIPEDVAVQADTIRRLPLGTLQRDARRSAASQASRWREKGAVAEAAGAGISQSYGYEDIASRYDKIAASGPHRGATIDRDELEEVANVYMKAWGEGWPVTAAVAEHFIIAKSTAAKRIMRARRAGLLGEAKRIR